MKIFTIIKPIAAMYMIWGVASFVFFYLGLILPDNEFIFQLLETVSITVFIFLASLITMLFIIHIEEQIKVNTSIRIVLLLITFL